MHGETVGATVAATVSDELSTLFSDFSDCQAQYKESFITVLNCYYYYNY